MPTHYISQHFLHLGMAIGLSPFQCNEYGIDLCHFWRYLKEVSMNSPCSYLPLRVIQNTDEPAIQL